MRSLAAVFAFLSIPLPCPRAAAPPERAVKVALARAGANRRELEKALRLAPAEQRAGMAFLVANMPDGDLRSLQAGFLLEHVALAYKARAEAPWGRAIPEERFLNDVLPYANLDEPREAWRAKLRETCLPLVKGCKTPAEAARKLNATIFAKLKVRYSTLRKRANQAPGESIATGLASCSGLSILLVDACRSVGVPARVVGTPLWADRSGNHTWVEVWDRRWQFTGAAEQDPAGMDRGWFAHRASQAREDVPAHAIYAASFRRTGLVFPLVWAPKSRDVHAENVTARYAKKAPEAKGTRVLVRVVGTGGKRLSLPVVVEELPGRREARRGQSKGEAADTNDHLAFDLPRGKTFAARVAGAEAVFSTAGAEVLVTVAVPAPAPLDAATLTGIEAEAKRFFEAKPEEQARWKFGAKLEAALAKNEAAVRRAVWSAYRGASIHEGMRKDHARKEVRSGAHVSPFTVKTVGKKPPGGWPLFIAMHGGGGVPKAFNDSQWKIMQGYYRDQPSVGGYKYVALRAPNDTWNGFYAPYVPPLIVNLIRQCVLFEEVSPGKVFLMGYSHGGYGAFYIGPRIPDRFAAVHASAAAPSDTNEMARNLRNTRFTFMIGEKDTAYGRAERCRGFNKVVEALKRDNKGAYPVQMEWKAGLGHGGLPDRDKIREMYPHRREAAPREVSWLLLDGVADRFFWLGVPKPGPGQEVQARIEGNTVTVNTKKMARLALYLDGRLVNFARPLTVSLNGKRKEVAIKPSLLTLCRTMAERGDIELASTCVVELGG